ncbi:hypothetical protein DAEQUDRAFT_238359 [Daedalea quercina L-15889]|uniref:Uncharacterized protein n=1 Tax=Daedalea quercina L-15889 TaxID=1314783 RepID=A0A165KG78_9APHY|nr:hypothetical protein DAEQUDRAFT_238359 [Daedalea quercina L-15889]
MYPARLNGPHHMYRLQAILLTHFYLNLNEATHDTNEINASGFSDASQMSDLRFERIVGRLTGSLSYDADSFELEDMDWEDELDANSDQEGIRLEEQATPDAQYHRTRCPCLT